MNSRKKLQKKDTSVPVPKKSLRDSCLEKLTDWNDLPFPDTIVTICMNCFMTGGPGKNMELINHHQLEEFEKGQKETPRLPTSLNHSHWQPSWLSNECTTRKDSESEWLVRDNLEINPITIKLKTGRHVAEQFSWVPLPYCSPPEHPLPVKSLAFSTHVSPQTIHFWVLAKSPIWALETEVLPATEGLMLKLKLNTLATWCKELIH